MIVTPFLLAVGSSLAVPSPGPAGPGAVVPQEATQDAAAFARASELLRALEAGAKASEAEKAPLLEELEALVPRARGPLFDLLLPGAKLPDGNPLGPEGRAVLVQALAAPSPGALFAFLSKRVDWESYGPERAAALELVAAHGGADQVALALELARWDEPPASRLRRGGREDLERTLTALLQRDRASFEALPAHWSKLPDELLGAALKALGRSGDPAALEPLLRELEGGGRVGGVAIAEVGRLLATLPAGSGQALVPRLTPLAHDAQASVRRGVASALGATGDSAAIPCLIDLLADGDHNVVDAAHRALVDLTGVSLRPDATRWRAWYEAESQWLADEAPDLLASLDSPEDAEVLEALRQLALHPLHSDRTVPAVTAQLDNASAPVRAQACRVLAALKAREAVPRLIEVLRLDDEGVWQEAWAALRAITGLDLPSDPDLWQERVAHPQGGDGF